MIVGTRKPLAEIQDMVKKYDRILLAGCDTCVAECASGGRREVAEMAAALEMAFRLAGQEKDLRETSVDRQCVHEFLLDVVDAAQDRDAVLSLACGAGVQALADRLPDTPVFPALNTQFIGETADRGLRQLHAGPHRRHLPGGPLRQEPAQRSLRRGPGRPV